MATNQKKLNLFLIDLYGPGYETHIVVCATDEKETKPMLANELIRYDADCPREEGAVYVIIMVTHGIFSQAGGRQAESMMSNDINVNQMPQSQHGGC